MNPEELERMQLEIERERVTLEREKAELSKSFFGRYSAVLIPAAVSFAAVVVSLGQVWITKISKDKEVEIAANQKRIELDLQDAQRKRELDISATKFVIENRDAIFNGTNDEQELFAKLISTIFPLDVSNPILHRLKQVSSTATKEAWQNAILASAEAEAVAFNPDRTLFATSNHDLVRIWDARSGEVHTTIRVAEPISDIQFSSDGKKLLLKSRKMEQSWDLIEGKPIYIKQY